MEYCILYSLKTNSSYPSEIVFNTLKIIKNFLFDFNFEVCNKLYYQMKNLNLNIFLIIIFF